jgi:hypothetical protein
MAHPFTVSAGTQSLVLYTEKGHKVPLDVEAAQLPIVIVSKNLRYFAVSLVEGDVKTDGERYIYLEIPVYQLDKDITPL